jgi:hypothetical protein
MRRIILIKTFATTVVSLASIVLTAAQVQAQSAITPAEARAIAKEAYIYGNPLADSYRILHGSFVNRKDPEYKGSWNRIHNIARVYTSDDKAVQTPNSDTPYSWLGLDLRAEPYVLTVSPIEKNRYFSIQLVDLYTHNFDYIGSRTTGNEGGKFLIAGPKWKGRAPNGITKTIRSETELMIGIYRTQLFDPGDIENVKSIQAKYELQPLSAFLGKPAPKAAPGIRFIEPLTRDELTKSPKIFQQINFVLQFCPRHPRRRSWRALRRSMSVGAGPSHGTSFRRKSRRRSARALQMPGPISQS